MSRAALPAHLTRAAAPLVRAALSACEQQAQGKPLDLDLGKVTAVDSAGAAMLARFVSDARKSGKEVVVKNMHPAIARALDLFPMPSAPPISEVPTKGIAERVGTAVQEAADVGLRYLLLCADVAWFTATGFGRKKGLRYDQMFFEMASMGSRAVGVVGLIAFLVGGTIALQSAAQLRTFGASLFVADLIGVAITRELGPLITAIVVAGRSGSAVAAEIATMVITEEIAALRTMGLNPVRFLIVPKVLAIAFTQPLLTMMANAVAISGGFVVAVLYLDVSPDAFIARLQTAVLVKDVLTGLFKSVLFANLIVTIGALCGLQTRGGADAVGRSTTTSVVASIFAIIVADAACSLLFYFGG